MKGSTPTTLLASFLLVLGLTSTALVFGQDVAGNPRSSPVCRQTGMYLVRNPQDCRSYFYCFEGQSFYGLCTAGHRFDERSQSCLQSTVRECFACPANGLAHLPDPAGCDRYVLCFEGIAHERVCPPGTLYSESVGQCDLRANVVCSQR